MSTNETPATFTPVKDQRGFTVIGYDIHVGDVAPALPVGYQRCVGAPAGSGPPPMSADLSDEVLDFLAERFRFRAGTRASTALDPTHKAFAAMLWPGTGILAREFAKQFPSDTPDSRLTFGPVWHVWANAVALDLGQVSLDNWIGTGTNFDDMAWIAVQVHGLDLAWHPTSKPYRVEQQQTWRQTRVADMDNAAFDRAMWFAGTSMARSVGQLCAGGTIDPTVVDTTHAITGDGVVLGSPISVTESRSVDPDDPRVEAVTYRKSRAVNPRRARTDVSMQNLPLDPKNEGKRKGKGKGSSRQRDDIQAPGRNAVFISTRVAGMAYSRVILAVGVVPSTTNEGTYATELLPEFVNSLEGAVHHVAWDMALLAQHRDTILKRSGAVVGNRNRTDELTDELRQAVATGGPVFGVTERRRKITYSATNVHLTKRTGRSKDRDVRKSTHATLGYVTHHLPDGATCEHLLAGDDGRLIELTADANGTPQPWPEILDGPTTGSMHRWTGPGVAPHDAPHVIVTRYQMVCDAADETLTLWLEHRPIDGAMPRSEQRIEHYVRALPESTDPDVRNQFNVIHGIRQDPESGNSKLRQYAKSKKGRVALYGDQGAWWTAVAFFVYENADTWIRRTRLFDR